MTVKGIWEIQGYVLISRDPPVLYSNHDGKYYIEGIGEISEEELKEDWRGWKPDRNCGCRRCCRIRPGYWDTSEKGARNSGSIEERVHPL